MDRYAVIGQPVAHSLSPRIHAAFAQACGQALSYERIEVAPEALGQTLQRLHDDNVLGLNVTLPHKVAVAAMCTAVTPRAEIAGAVNTLVRTEAGYAGDNTDGDGFVRDLTRNLGIAVAGRRVLVLGAGGAARGILAPLLALRPAELTLSNRSPWKPEELATQFQAHGRVRPCTHAALKGDRYDLVINATSAGHHGEMPRLPGPLLAAGGDAYDLSYGKAHAPFAEWARTQGARLVADGLGMLVEQAALSFARWRGVEPDTAPVLQALRAELAA